jgi:hypothetical protein
MFGHCPSRKLLGYGIVKASVIGPNQRVKINRARWLHRSGWRIWIARLVGQGWILMAALPHACERKVSSCCDCRNAKRCTANDQWSHIYSIPECPPEYRDEPAGVFRTNRLMAW